MLLRLKLSIVLAIGLLNAYCQCPTIIASDASFARDGVCAPVNVTAYTATYTFLSAQDPNNVVIRFEWNDPLTSIDNFVNGAGLVASMGNTVFEATGTFTYLRGNECSYVPTASLLFSGDICESQTQTVFAWDNDDNFGGTLAINPNDYEVCENTALVDVVFTDNSTFNCNPFDVDPGVANTEARHTQFAYGTNHPGNSFRNLTVNDGGPQSVTNGTGALTSADTRGTVAEQITAGYFGPIVEVPFQAQAPNNQSFAISAPADVNNTIGSTFEVTMFNWNTCNPYNMDPANPNYVDAVRETVTISVVAPPVPDFDIKLGNAAGSIQSLFCLGQDIFFDNTTTGPGTYNYTWIFYEDNTATDTAALFNTTDVTYAYNNPGQKLVRLYVTDPNVDGNCTFFVDGLVDLSPDAIAGIEVYEGTFTTLTPPVFCQDGSSMFTVGFRDVTSGVEPQTEWRWEFLEDDGVTLIESLPAGLGTYSATQEPDFTRDFTGEELVIVRLIARNNVTNCESTAIDSILVYDEPVAAFSNDDVCIGNRTTFSAIADSVTSLGVRVNDDRVIQYEWDFSYDGISFNVEHSRDNDNDFMWYLDGTNIALNAEPIVSVAGTYTVALRMTTEKGGCSDLFTSDVTVHPLPDASISASITSVCPGDPVTITNLAPGPGGTNYSLTWQHTPSAFSSMVSLTATDTTLTFFNPDDSTRTYEVFLFVESAEGCQQTSTSVFIQVFNDENSNFNDPLYSFSSTNCSPWSSTFIVDEATQNLAADSYTWTIVDSENNLLSGFPVSKVSSDPNFHQLPYEITNDSLTIARYDVILEVAKTGVCIANDTFSIQISPQPKSTFTLAKTDDCDVVTFQLEAAQKGLSYNWSFDPTPSTVTGNDDVQVITYNRNQNADSDFNVEFQLVTSNIANCASDTSLVSATVEKKTTPILALFTVSNDSIQLPDSTITFLNLSTRGSLNYNWSFGDGDSSNLFDPGAHNYSNAGRFQAVLEVSDVFCETSHQSLITVLPADPIIDFVADTLFGCSPLTIAFTNLSQFAEPGLFTWDFGDGNTSNVDNPVHTYFADGDYSVTLVGDNGSGVIGIEEKVAYVQVSGTPFADFRAAPQVVYIPDQEVTFNNLSRNATTYFWDFGDGETSTEERPNHPYANEGFYDILLIANNELGCSDTLFRNTEVQAIIGGTVSAPNAFTPNLSGPSGGEIGLLGNSDPARLNDIFLPQAEGVTKFRMFIYNKWGQLLFSSDSQFRGWDGYFNGLPSPSGVYVFRLELTYSDQREEVRVGDLTLLR